MAKTIMVSNDVYDALKVRKGGRSFSELLRSVLAREPPEGADVLRECFGAWKGKADETYTKELQKAWARWNKRYA